MWTNGQGLLVVLGGQEVIFQAVVACSHGFQDSVLVGSPVNNLLEQMDRFLPAFQGHGLESLSPGFSDLVRFFSGFQILSETAFLVLDTAAAGAGVVSFHGHYGRNSLRNNHGPVDFQQPAIEADQAFVVTLA
jgi:hypothetical protein